MWWEEEPKKSKVISSEVVDLAFDMVCHCLPVDHAYALSQAIQQALPWFTKEPLAGLHLIHGGESGHGWQRPSEPDSLLYLSRRTKLMLRLPPHRITAAQELTGLKLDMVGYSLQVGKATVKPLTPLPALFARHLLAKFEEDEEMFLLGIVAQLQQLAIPCRKILCGKTGQFRMPEGKLFTRSLMVADLTPLESIKLQQYGLGSGRQMGCGLFVPHQNIKAVKSEV